MRNLIFLLIVGFLLIIIADTHAEPFTYHWEIDETPSGSESVSVVKPVEVTLVDEPVKVSYSTASLKLRQQYGIYLSDQWNSDLAQLLLSTLESVLRPNMLKILWNFHYQRVLMMKANITKLSRQLGIL